MKFKKNFFFLSFHLQFISGVLNYTGASLCATSYYLPRAYNAPLGGALVALVILFFVHIALGLSSHLYITLFL